jgi:hypothetical protein
MVADAKPLLSAEQAELPWLCLLVPARLSSSCTRPGRVVGFLLSSHLPPLFCASVLSVLCSLRLFALSVLFCAISFFHALNCRYQSKRPGLALQISASHLPRIAIAVLLLLFLVRALAAHAHTLTTQYPLFLRLAGSRNPSAYPLPTLTRHLFVSD